MNRVEVKIRYEGNGVDWDELPVVRMSDNNLDKLEAIRYAEHVAEIDSQLVGKKIDEVRWNYVGSRAGYYFRPW